MKSLLRSVIIRIIPLSGVHMNIGVGGGPLTLWQEVSNVDLGTNSIQVTNAIKEVFDTAQPEDSFDVKVVVKYYYPSYTGLPSYENSYPYTQYVYVPKRAAG